jgi:hypothetical protein
MELNIETIVAKSLRIFVSIYPVLRSERLGVGTKLTLYKAFITSVLSCFCTVTINKNWGRIYAFGNLSHVWENATTK